MPGLEWIFVQKSAKMSKISLVVNRKPQISDGSDQASSWQRVEIQMPPGLSPRELRVEQVDGDGVCENMEDPFARGCGHARCSIS